MLDGLRAFARTWPAKIFFAVLVLSFALFGISNVIFDLGTNTIARVGDQEITARQFQRAYNQQMSAIGQQYGTFPTNEEAVAMGIPNSVIGQLGAQAAINQLGEDFGLGVSEERLSKMLREDPSFAGTLGGFDRNSFVAVLQQNGFTEAEYFQTQADASRRQQVASALFADSAVPAAAVELVSRYSGDTRTIDYFTINPQSLPPIADPTTAELEAYMAEHQAEYRTEETRTVDVLALSPEILATTIEISDDEIAAEYERTKANLTRPERRTIRQVALTDETAAASFEAGKTAGRTFDELAAEADLPVTELGTLAQAEISDAALATAAFGLAQGDFVVIPGVGGKRAVSVSAVEAGGEVSLDEAREDIRNKLAVAKARTDYVDILDQVEEFRAAFKPIPEIASTLGLTSQSLTVSASGRELSPITDLTDEDRTKVAQAIFAAEPGDLAPSVVLGANKHTWFDLTNVEAARDQTIDEVRDAVVLALTEQRTQDAMIAEVDKVLAELDAGAAIADIAAARGQFPVLSQPFSRQGDGSPVINADVAASAFAGGVGHHGAAQNEDGDYVVYSVVEIVPPGPENAEAARAFIESASRDTLYSQFVSGLLETTGLRINQQALSQVLALDATAAQ